MTCEEVIEFYRVLHNRMVSTGGTDWFIDVGDELNPKISAEEVLNILDSSENKRIVNRYRYYIQPASCSAVGPINPEDSIRSWEERNDGK